VRGARHAFAQFPELNVVFLAASKVSEPPACVINTEVHAGEGPAGALITSHPTLTIRARIPLNFVNNKLETVRKKDLEVVTLILRSGAVTAEQIHAFVQGAQTPEETKLAIVKKLQRILERNRLNNRSSSAGKPPAFSG
jgi:hypothetical protein